MFVSSAQWYVFENLILLCKSFIWIRKRSGPRTDLCGTPVKGYLIEDIIFSILTIGKLFSFFEVKYEPFIGYTPYAILVESFY